MAGRAVMSLSKSLRRLRPLPLLAAAPTPPPLRRLCSTSPSPSPPPPPPAAAETSNWKTAVAETSNWKTCTRCLTLPDEETDYEHWVVVMKPPDSNTSPDQLKQIFTDTLAQILDSEDEARAKIYSVSLNHVIAFGARISEELSNKISEVPNVARVIPDSYVEEENNVFGILDIAYRDEEWERDHKRSRECWLAERMIRRIRVREKYKDCGWKMGRYG